MLIQHSNQFAWMNNTDMELLFLSLLLILSLFLSLSLYALYFTIKKTPQNLPPGKLGWPIVGETLDFHSKGRKGIPETFIKQRMKKYCSQIFKTSLLGEKTLVFCGPTANKFLFSNENKLVRVWWPRSIEKIFPISSSQTLYTEESKKLRKVLVGFLKPEALQKYIAIMDAVAREHFETFWDFNKQVVVFPLAKHYTFSVACRLFLSIDDPEYIAKFEVPFDAMASGIISLPIDIPGTNYNRAIKAAKVIRKQLLEIIKERKKDLTEGKVSSSSSSKHDILSHILTTTDDNGQFMNEMEVTNKIIALLLGGHDTASVALTFTVKYLAELPHVYDQVLKEQTRIASAKKTGELLNWEDIQKMRYSWNVACEVMRLVPPLPGTFRKALTDFKFSGYSIPKGWKLYWTANSTHKDPNCFPEPEKFEPSRFEGIGPAPYTYVPFGGGPRMCPGQEYARVEILVFMYNIVTRFRWEKIIPDENIIVDPLPKLAKGLPVRIYPHETQMA